MRNIQHSWARSSGAYSLESNGNAFHAFCQGSAVIELGYQHHITTKVCGK